MDCGHIRIKMTEYLFGELSPEDRAAYEAHLETCGDCRRRITELKQVHERVSSTDLEYEFGPRLDPSNYRKGVIYMGTKKRRRRPSKSIFASVGQLAVLFLIIAIFGAISVPDFNRARLQARSKSRPRYQAPGYPPSSPAPSRRYTAPTASPSFDMSMNDGSFGTSAPNGQPYNNTFFKNYGVNPFVSTEDEVFSTFGMDVDTASYAIARRFINDSNLPEKDAVRTEEFINSFDQDYTDHQDAFSIHVAGARSQFGQPHYHLLRVGIKARDVSFEERKPANMVFVVDVSGSMNQENRLGLVKRSLYLLSEQLKEGDRVGLVIYGSRGEVVSDLTHDKRAIVAAIRKLTPGGVTNAEEGLFLAYRMARRHYDEQKINRIILCSDGVANVGTIKATDLLNRVRSYAKKGISLTSLGFGMGEFNDVFMEQLANNGDGNYHYIDRMAEARDLFADGAVSLLQVIGSDAKIQVEFNPRVVDRYRLLGYENRRLAADDFLDDTVDAGEVGAGQTVTALYEVRVKDEALAKPANLLGQVRIRYMNVDTYRVEQVERPVQVWDVNREFSEADPRFRFTAAVAEFAEVLKKSYWAKNSSYSAVLSVAKRAVKDMSPGTKELEFLTLVSRTRTLAGEDVSEQLSGPRLEYRNRESDRRFDNARSGDSFDDLDDFETDFE